VALAQTLPTINTLKSDTLSKDDVADIQPDFKGGYHKLSKYIGDELNWEEVLKWQDLPVVFELVE
jgi:hypothetical protein